MSSACYDLSQTVLFSTKPENCFVVHHLIDLLDMQSRIKSHIKYITFCQAVSGDRYYKVIETADAVPALPLEYTDLCSKTEDFYDAADRYMMTVCDMVIAVTAGEDEPDALVYARDKGKPIMYIDANTYEVRQ